MLTYAELKDLVATGEIDTVVVAFTDMQGRLLGKRLHAEFFVDEMDAGHPVEGCNYLLALEMEMDPVPGLRDRELGAGLRRLRDHARHGDAAPDPVARGARRSCSATSAGTTARPSSPRRARCSARRWSGRRSSA